MEITDRTHPIRDVELTEKGLTFTIDYTLPPGAYREDLLREILTNKPYYKTGKPAVDEEGNKTLIKYSAIIKGDVFQIAQVIEKVS